jgi:ribulose bisphosphate carboxylase small subunit
LWLGDHLFGAALGVLLTIVAGYFLTTNLTSSSPNPIPHVRPAGKRYVHRDSWPDGVTAWTVILASSASRGEAEAAINQARRVPSRGLSLGILHSNDYRLTRGYWVAFAGQFDTSQEAQEATYRYKRQFPTSYERLIEER